VLLAIGLGATRPAGAEVRPGADLSLSGSVAVVSDYVFRGISQTAGRPAGQVSLDLAAGSGPYLGLFASQVRYAGTDARYNLAISGGTRFQVAALQADLRAVWYEYPGYQRRPGREDLRTGEAILEVSHARGPLTMLGGLAWMPGFTASMGSGLYLEAGLDWSLPWPGTLLSGRLGHQWVGRRDEFGTPSHLSHGFSVTHDLAAGAALSVGWFGTNLDRAACGKGETVCEGRLVGALSWSF
jgi:uncharacterized protein (TIGR02001 family)